MGSHVKDGASRGDGRLVGYLADQRGEGRLDGHLADQQINDGSCCPPVDLHPIPGHGSEIERVD